MFCLAFLPGSPQNLVYKVLSHSVSILSLQGPYGSYSSIFQDRKTKMDKVECFGIQE